MDKSEIVKLLEIENFSDEYYDLIRNSAKMTRDSWGNKGYIFAQIGINGGKCEGNCKFCSMANKYYSLEAEFNKTKEEILQESEKLINEGVSDLFLMTTVGYSLENFLDIGKAVKKILPTDRKLVANTGDFDYNTAMKLKDAGFTGAYHIKRLREGIDTEIAPETRVNTIENIKKAGLDLYYCIEPIGPEHTYEEIADEIIFARDLNIGAMAAMRRIAVPNTPLFAKGQITKAELIKIGAVARIVTNPSRSMNIHETVEGSLLAGINQLYAEVGANPRDTASNTAVNRGLCVNDIKNLFNEYNITL